MLLVSIYRRSERTDMMSSGLHQGHDKHILNSTDHDLDQRIYQRLQLALFSAFRFQSSITSFSEGHRPEVDSVNELPVVDLLIGLLHVSKFSTLMLNDLDKQIRTNLAFNLHAIPQMDRELPDEAKSMLICCSLIGEIQLGRGILH